MKKQILSKVFLAALVAFSMTACDDDDDDDKLPAIEIADNTLDAIVTNYVNAVVLPTYKDLAEKNAALYDAVVKLKETPSDAAFETACDAWMNARQPWESSEAFLFGPVDELGLDPNMDSWPLDQEAIEKILSSGNFAELNWGEGDDSVAVEAAQSVRGFHTLEYLLFKDGKPRSTNDEDYKKSAESWGNYMLNVATLLKNDAQSLYDAWNKSYDNGDAYATTFKSHNNSTYSSAINCIEEIFDGCADIASEVGTSKIKAPYDLYKSGKTEEGLYAVESWYSWHSRDDYSNNIRSIRNSYFGSLDGTIANNSLAKAVAEKDAEADKKLKDAITAAIDAIQAIPQPFRNNIVCAESEAAMEACNNLESVLNELKGRIVR